MRVIVIVPAVAGGTAVVGVIGMALMHASMMGRMGRYKLPAAKENCT